MFKKFVQKNFVRIFRSLDWARVGEPKPKQQELVSLRLRARALKNKSHLKVFASCLSHDDLPWGPNLLHTVFFFFFRFGVLFSVTITGNVAA